MSFRFMQHGETYVFIADANDPHRDDELLGEMMAWCRERFGKPGRKSDARWSRWKPHPAMVGQGDYLPPYIEMFEEVDAFEARMRWC